MYPLQFICLYIDGGYEIGENFENHILQLSAHKKPRKHTMKRSQLIYHLNIYVYKRYIYIYMYIYIYIYIYM